MFWGFLVSFSFLWGFFFFGFNLKLNIIALDLYLILKLLVSFQQEKICVMSCVMIHHTICKPSPPTHQNPRSTHGSMHTILIKHNMSELKHILDSFHLHNNFLPHSYRKTLKCHNCLLCLICPVQTEMIVFPTTCTSNFLPQISENNS